METADKAQAVVEPHVICDICKAEAPKEAMADFDYLTPNGEHQTGLACPMCDDAMKQEREERESMMQVTKEMAIDAGDCKLEGQWIKW